MGHKAISYSDESSTEEREVMLVFGGGDNDGDFYDDLFQVCVWKISETSHMLKSFQIVST